ncbi:unnamed protein product [Brassica oleracea var. botrytis]
MRNYSLTISPSLARITKYFCSSTCNLDAAVSKSEHVAPELIPSTASSNGRVMLIDGTSIMYRAYYKLLGIIMLLMLNHGHLTHADGNADCVLTLFSALSLIIDVLKFLPSHVASLFAGVAYGSTSNSSNGYHSSKGMNFRHTFYPA